MKFANMHLAIVAGGGKLPLFCAREVKKQKIPFKIFLYQEETQDTVGIFFSEFKENCTLIRLGKLGELISALKKNQISHVIFIGKIHKQNLFRGMKYDLKTLSLLTKMKNQNDSEFFRVLLLELKKHKIEVLPQSTFLKNFLLPEGVLTKKKPQKKDWQDIKFGLYYARKIGELDIGQTVVVLNKTILAVEALEGTDACIERAGILSQGKGGVVCKAERANQDPRFDIPTVGISTLETMKKVNCHLLAFESEKVFVVEPEEFINYANKNQLVVVSHKTVKEDPFTE